MDISKINPASVTADMGIKIGSDNAPKQLIEFINLNCPFCRKWFDDSHSILDEAVKKNQVQRIIKFLNKDKDSLQRGNVMHEYVDFGNAHRAQMEISEIFDTQDEWGDLSLDEVAKFAEEELSLKKQNVSDTLKEIKSEATLANIKLVPTVIIGTHIFDESITAEELQQFIEE